VASIDGIIQKLLPHETILARAFSITPQSSFPRERILTKLDEGGYRRVSLVEEVGDYAARGCVVDFFPPGRVHPIRVEYLGHTIDRLRSFDIDTQRSLASVTEVSVPPAREWFMSGNGMPGVSIDEAIENLKTRGKTLETQPREIARIMHSVRTGLAYPGIEVHQAVFYPTLATFFDYCAPQTHFVINDEIAVHQSLDASWEIITEREARIVHEHELIPSKEAAYISPGDALSTLKARPHTMLDSLEAVGSAKDTEDLNHVNLRAESLVELTTKLKTKVGSGAAYRPLRDLITIWRQSGFSVAVVVGSDSRADRAQKLLLEYELDAKILTTSGSDWARNERRYPLVILRGHLSSGVRLPTQKLIFIAEHEIFSERSYRKAGRASRSIKRLMGSLAQLKEGDFVVHVDYGVGLYRGLKHITVGDTQGDFLHIDYAGESRLYLPVQNIAKIQKFSAAEGQVPQLDKLGSNRWAKTKESVREAVQTLAGDLIKLYATRSVAKGWRFDTPGASDEKFGEDFPFTETPDQLKAIDETLKDLASDKPTDRLICGDAGFGKTEVAMRAAYKCTQHARQVAVLVPTTILAEQHKETFAQRFSGYPVKIAAISRFYSPEDNRRALAELASGELDIIIGTHKLLQKDIQFKDLGLLIIDEEHRFGVKQKERLKQLKKQVDVITLTATPIPRTLHMSLLGIRDISVISTPPTDRQIIRTYVATQGETIVRDAVLRELQRSGQCFYLHNRVDSIPVITAELKALVPEARFEFAHGQMHEKQLEDIMHRFINKQIDVLVSTTIIESGLDIPNANTIIIERADMFGLAQLYQLRGRVGRSNRQAYCYLLVPKTSKLGTDAQKRLKVLQGLDDLGLGFNLAIRDMEIRGAGNLLGKEQSGSVLAVGFDLYSKILKEAILNLKGEDLDLAESIDPEVKLGLPAFIPEHYIPDISERLVLYQRLSGIVTDEDAEELKVEIEDRFGPIGTEVANYLELMKLRSALKRYGVLSADFSAGKLTLSLSPKVVLDTAKVLLLVQKDPTSYRIGKNSTMTIRHHREEIHSPRELLDTVDAFFSHCAV